MGEQFPSEPLEDVPAENRERAQELRYQLFVLEARLENANFENEEAYRRQIDDKRGELEQLKE